MFINDALVPPKEYGKLLEQLDKIAAEAQDDATADLQRVRWEHGLMYKLQEAIESHADDLIEARELPAEDRWRLEMLADSLWYLNNTGTLLVAVSAAGG